MSAHTDSNGERSSSDGIDSPLFDGRPIALVTGASRGVGRGVALALARAGHDIVATARTVREGSAINPATGQPLRGSLETLADEIEAIGARCHVVAFDLLDLDAVEEFVDDVFERVGRIDVLVNNAVYVGPGNDALFVDNQSVDIRRRVDGNLTSPLLVSRAYLRHALDQPPDRSGVRARLVNVTSDAGRRTPERVAGNGGWSLVYAASKAGFHRIADMVAHEYGHLGVRAVNVNPGLVATERVLDSGESLEWIARLGVPPSVVGEAVVRLLADPLIGNGAYVHAQPYLREALGDTLFEELVARSAP